VERWQVIPGFSNYGVSDHGQIVNRVTEHVLAQAMNQYGVVFVGLFRQGEQFKRSVPKLVATAFIPNSFEAYDTPINVDGNRWNNHVNNLLWRPRWFAVKYNRQFRMDTGFHIPFPIEDIKTGEVTANSLECARMYALLEKDIYLSIYHRTYTWPTHQQFRIIGD
jgi:hypothetical protein